MDCTKKGTSLSITEQRLSKPYSKSMVLAKPGIFAQGLEINSGEKTGDDYYWLYQQQLQNSALQFKPLHKISLPDIQEPGKEKPALNREISKTDFVQKLSLPLSQSLAVATDYDYQIWTQGFIDVINLVYDQTNSFNPAANPGFSQKKTTPSLAAEPLANKLFTRPLIYKNYQLFIRADEAELSLKSEDLSNEQIRELNLLVKQWLNNKGIKLGHLVINGVKQ